MRRRNVKTILKLIEKYYIDMLAHLQEEKVTRRGRPKKYPDYLIISLGVLKEMFGLSFREALEIAKAYFKEVPSLRDFHYRLSKVEYEIKQLIEYIHDSLQRDIKSVIVDGTGIGYKDTAYLNWMRGTQVRKVKDHIRCEVIMTKGRYKLIKYVELGKAYSSEVKLLRKILDKVEIEGEKFIADKMYDVIWLDEYVKSKGMKGVIKRKKGSKRAKVDEGEYKERNEIEGMFGNIKAKLGGCVNAFREDIARVLSLMKFLIYNLYIALFLSYFEMVSSVFFISIIMLFHHQYGIFETIPPCV